MDAEPQQIQDFYLGIVPEEIERYSNAFGTYDYPGVFFVKGLEKEVIGIEYRDGDSRVEYPEGLKKIPLDAAFFYSVEIDDDVDVNLPFIKKLCDDVRYMSPVDKDLASKLEMKLIISANALLESTLTPSEMESKIIELRNLINQRKLLNK